MSLIKKYSYEITGAIALIVVSVLRFNGAL